MTHIMTPDEKDLPFFIRALHAKPASLCICPISNHSSGRKHHQTDCNSNPYSGAQRMANELGGRSCPK